MTPRPNLRDHLLRSLSQLPGPTRTYAVHVLESVPRLSADVFPYVSPRPRWSIRDVLVIVSEELVDEEAASSQSASASTQAPAPTPIPSALRARVFVCALDAVLYTHTPTRTALLYISKVDSTGQARNDAPAPTRAFVAAFVQYYADVKTRPRWFSPPGSGSGAEGQTGEGDSGTLFVHVFARAQRQYLFPNSADYTGKRVLSDQGLCKWWRSTLSPSASMSLAAYYVLPGMDSDDALRALGPAPNGWTYGHPYNDARIPFSARGMGLGITGLIPWFEDDAKSRFIDDLVSTNDESSGAGLHPMSPKKRKRRKVEEVSSPGTSTSSEMRSHSEGAQSFGQAVSAVVSEPSSSTRSTTPLSSTLEPTTPLSPSASAPGKTLKLRKLGALAHVSADEFWERIAFRQECSQGAITGFFVLVFGDEVGGKVTATTSATRSNGSSTIDPDNGSLPAPRAPDGTNLTANGLPSAVDPPSTVAAELSQQLISRVRNALVQQQEFGNRPRAIRSTEIVEGLTRGLMLRQGTALGVGAGGINVVEGSTAEAREGAEVAGGDVEGGSGALSGTYWANVFGTCETCGAALAERLPNATAVAQPVTVLAVRRKRKV